MSRYTRLPKMPICYQILTTGLMTLMGTTKTNKAARKTMTMAMKIILKTAKNLITKLQTTFRYPEFIWRAVMKETDRTKVMSATQHLQFQTRKSGGNSRKRNPLIRPLFFFSFFSRVLAALQADGVAEMTWKPHFSTEVMVDLSLEFS